MIAADVEAVIAKAHSQVGVAENPAYSNRTPYTRWYGLIGPWCAMWVSWVFWHAGYPLPPIRTTKGFAYCPDIVNWAKKNGTWRASSSNYVPKRGDIVLFDFIGRPSHVGIVIRMLADGRVQTIEGNTNGSGSRDGGAVVIHNRNRRGSTIGFVEVRNLNAPTQHQEALMVTPEDEKKIRTIIREEMNEVRGDVWVTADIVEKRYGSLRGWLKAIADKLGVTRDEAAAADTYVNKP